MEYDPNAVFARNFALLVSEAKQSNLSLDAGETKVLFDLQCEDVTRMP